MRVRLDRHHMQSERDISATDYGHVITTDHVAALHINYHEAKMSKARISLGPLDRTP